MRITHGGKLVQRIQAAEMQLKFNRRAAGHRQRVAGEACAARGGGKIQQATAGQDVDSLAAGSSTDQ